MHPTLLRQVQSVSRSLRNLLPTELPPTLSPPQRTNLYEVLSRLPRDSKGVIVHQTRWALTSKDAYWRITQANFKCEGKHGKAWGTLYRNGQLSARARGSSNTRWSCRENS
jgi:small subunit ribosomal protein S34